MPLGFVIASILVAAAGFVIGAAGRNALIIVLTRVRMDSNQYSQKDCKGKDNQIDTTIVHGLFVI